ncbi:hypothetical protein D3C72_2165310 [compost metagenome]
MNQFLLFFAQGFIERRLVKAQTICNTQTEFRFYEAPLEALEARRRIKHVAEIQEIKRRHCFEHINLIDDHALNANNTFQTSTCSAHFSFCNLSLLESVLNRS